MSKWKMAAFEVGLLLAATFANAASKTMMRIQVLDSETHSVSTQDNGVPRNCDAVNYDAYCHGSKTETVTNTLLVQEGNGTPFRVACTVDSKWSRCAPLPKGMSYDAKREKRGLTIYYADETGKLRKQLYSFVTAEGSPASAPDSAATPPAASDEKAGQADKGSSQQTAKCSFDSTPSGAEIILDGRYVGSTPSVLGLNTGNHVVQMSLPGYLPWKRELAVSSGSELTVNAVLEKVQ